MSCLRVLHDNKEPGCHGIPIETYRDSPTAKQELFAIVRLMWKTEVIPPAIVRGTFVMLYKKGPRDNFGNYRAIGFMCHSYTLLSMLVLHRMHDDVESRLAETQAGFRRERGCRDNVLLLRLLMDAVLRAGKRAAITFIDYRAAFDTISHRFLDESLTAAGALPKIRPMVKAIYAEATVMVRLRLPSGDTLCSEPFPVRRGVIQGDIFSPQCFTRGLVRIFRLHDIAGQGIGGSRESISKPRLSTGSSPVRKDAVTSGFASDLFTVYLDDKGQTILVICLQFTLSKKAKQCILTICKKIIS